MLIGLEMDVHYVDDGWRLGSVVAYRFEVLASRQKRIHRMRVVVVIRVKGERE